MLPEANEASGSVQLLCASVNMADESCKCGDHSAHGSPSALALPPSAGRKNHLAVTEFQRRSSACPFWSIFCFCFVANHALPDADDFSPKKEKKGRASRAVNFTSVVNVVNVAK